jgi:hypothetical protein
MNKGEEINNRLHIESHLLLEDALWRGAMKHNTVLSARYKTQKLFDCSTEGEWSGLTRVCRHPVMCTDTRSAPLQLSPSSLYKITLAEAPSKKRKKESCFFLHVFLLL